LFRSDFLLWTLSALGRVAPAAVAPTLFATPAPVVRLASTEERARLREILDHLLPISARSKGMQFDLETARAPKALELEKIACPVLAISAIDDRFDTAVRAQAIAKTVSNGRSVIYASGGHALVGRQAEAIGEVTAFLRGM
jgi:pimeloyl-ACP methyl ester carboxylesterase